LFAVLGFAKQCCVVAEKLFISTDLDKYRDVEVAHGGGDGA
jgi:hypothetical protein